LAQYPGTHYIQSVTACSEGRGSAGEALLNPLGEPGQLRSLQVLGQVAHERVDRVDFFLKRRVTPRMQMGTNLCTPVVLYSLQQIHSPIRLDHRGINQVRGSNSKAVA
jgi:hypothetical protein